MAFSKTVGELVGAYCLHFAYYTSAGFIATLRVHSCNGSGIADHVWDIAELLA